LEQNHDRLDFELLLIAEVNQRLQQLIDCFNKVSFCWLSFLSHIDLCSGL